MTHFKHSVNQVEECGVVVSDYLLYLHNIIFALHTDLWDAPSHISRYDNVPWTPRSLESSLGDLYFLVFTSTAGYTNLNRSIWTRWGSQFQKSLTKSQSCYLRAMQAFKYGLRTVSSVYLIIFFIFHYQNYTLSFCLFFIESYKNYWTYSI